MSDPTRVCWYEMIRRCYNPERDNYEFYGGRGIGVCEEWRESYTRFREDMGPRPPGTTLDRIDPEGSYYKENCRWATDDTQANNKRNSRLLSHKRMTLSVSQWARRKGLPVSTLRDRIGPLGWSVGRALETPRKVRKKAN